MEGSAAVFMQHGTGFCCFSLNPAGSVQVESRAEVGMCSGQELPLLSQADPLQHSWIPVGSLGFRQWRMKCVSSAAELMQGHSMDIWNVALGLIEILAPSTPVDIYDFIFHFRSTLRRDTASGSLSRGSTMNCTCSITCRRTWALALLP